MIFRKHFLLIAFIMVILSIFAWYGYSYYINSRDKSVFYGYDIENGSFFGTSSSGKPYNMRANSIKNIGKNLYKLNKLYAKYHIDEETHNYTEAISNTGIFNETKNLLTMNGDVEFILSQGYKMTTDRFFIDMNKNIAFTQEEVMLIGSQGKILSKKGITVYMKDNKAILHGPIQSVFIESKSIN